MTLQFDELTEYVTAGPVIHAVELSQHALESMYSVLAVARGYIHRANLGRAVLEGEVELAFVLSEWTSEGGLPDAPGVVASAVLKGWSAKSIAAAYIIANTATINAINASRTVAVALIRLSLVQDGTNALDPMEPFTSAQVGFLAVWLNEHDITNAEFAALFDVSAALLSNWLQNHPRWQFAAQLHERFT